MTPQEQTNSTWFNRLALLFILLFLISGIATQAYYGLSWDEGLGNLFFGERYFLRLLTSEDKYLDFETNLDFHQRTPLNLYLSPFRQYPNEFPAFADTLSATSMYLFSYILKWMDPVDAFHLFTILLCTLFLWVLYRFTAKRAGAPTALMAIILLGTFPRFWGDMHFNPKDVPETVFFGLVIMAYVVWYEKPHILKALLTGVLFGCALGIKANALFIPFILIIGVWPWGISPRSWLNNLVHLGKLLPHYLVMGAGSIAIYFLSWPYLYQDPMRIRLYFSYILSQGEREGSAGWNWQPLLQTLATMPELMLLFLLVGLVLVLRQNRRQPCAFWRVLPIWLVLPVVRASMPGTVNFDGIRHFLEFVPAAAVISAFGMVSSVRWLSCKLPRLQIPIRTTAILLLTINLAFIYVSFHPYQHLYYNQIVGGLSGARQVFGDNEATDYWATGYRQGIRWLNENALPYSLVYVPIANHLVELTESIWLRSDLQVFIHDFLDDIYSQKNPVYVMFITRPGFYDSVAVYCNENLAPVHQISADGVPVIKIFLLEGKP